MSADGAVRAMVGGRKIEEAGSFNRATQALRQTGSSFKPFVYAAALDLGWSPSDFVEDTPLTIRIPGSGPWTPDNYDHEFKGLITLTEALKESRNIPAVRVSEAVGREAVRAVASGFGIQSDLAAGPALALGASESTLIEMTGAYAGILNGGSAVTPYGLVELKLKGENEALMGAGGGIGERVISEQAAQLLTYMMAQVVDSGTGTRARLDGHPAAGKTGTTSAARDAWFIGFTADYVTGVWIGYDDNTPLKGVTGGGLPAEIWHEVMTRIEDGIPPHDLPMIVPEPRLPPQSAQPTEPAPEIAPVDPGAAGNGDNAVDSLIRDPLALSTIFSVPPAPLKPLEENVTQRLAMFSVTNDTYRESGWSLMTPPGESQPDNLTALRGRGAKVVLYHGVSDAIFSAEDTRQWVERLGQAKGNPASDFARYFPVPGMNHCSAGLATDQFDLLTPLVKWVEQGEAPQAVLASVRGAGNAGGVNPELPADWSPGRTRPLCAAPTVATYKGTGSVEDAKNFVCT